MKKRLVIFINAIILTSLSLVALPIVAADAVGKWKRPNGSIAKVYKCNRNKLCATVISGKSSGFNMFMKGLRKTGNKTWSGKMKHPEMDARMTFTVVVKQLSSKKLSVKGCTLDGSFCNTKKWPKVK